MNLIKVIGYSIIGSLFLFLLILTLLVADFLIFRVMSQGSRSPEAAEIIAERFKQDTKLSEVAREHGYFPLVFPDYSTSDNEYVELAYKHGIFPLGGLPNKKTYFCNEGYGLIKYMSDRFGFRNDDSKWDELSSHNSVLLIGDSFTHGACVNDQNTISENLNSLGIGNINLAISSNSAGHYAALADEFIEVVNPEVVVVTFYRNDRYGRSYSIQDNHFGSKHPYVLQEDEGRLNLSKRAEDLFQEIEALSLKRVKKGTTNSGGRISLVGEGYNRITDGFKRHSSLPGIRYLVLKTLNRLERFSVGSSETRQVFDVLNDKCSQFGCRVIIVWLAESEFWDADIFSDGYKKFILDTASEYNFEIIDTTTFIDGSARKNYAILGPHYSPDTYLKISLSISNLIKN